MLQREYEKKSPSEVPIHDSLMKLKTKKKAVRRRRQKYGTNISIKNIREHFKWQEKKYKILLTEVKTTKIKEEIDDCQKDTKKLYELVVILQGLQLKIHYHQEKLITN